MTPEQCCEILGVSMDITDDNLKKKYRQLALIHHPDRSTGNADTFIKIKYAYETLSAHIKIKPKTSNNWKGGMIINFNLSDGNFTVATGPTMTQWWSK